MFKVNRHLPKAIFKLHSNITPVKASGSWIFANNNKKYLDLTSGIGALSTGHSHPYIVSKVKEQLDKLVHIPQQVFETHPPQIELTQKLLEIMPNKSLDNIFYVNSGSEATDNAIRIARRYTNKTNIIAISGGFHGRTIGALSITSSNLNCKLHSQPLLPGVFFCNQDDIEHFNHILSYQTSPQDTAAVIFESILGEGGVKSLSSDFLHHIQDICNINNIMLIADEVQCGSGRTGDWWNISNKDIIPDIMTFGKGIASGFPLAAIASSSIIMNNIGTSYLGGTYGGNAITSTAASATIDVIKNENILENAIIQGNKIKQLLLNIPYIKDIRQYGLMIAFSLEEPYHTNDFVNQLRDLNILVLLSGNNNQYIRLLPPLNITDEEIDFFSDNLHKIVKL